MPRYERSWTDPHPHRWIDPDEPPIQRRAYAPIIGELRHQMKPGRTYKCQVCGAEVTIPESFHDQPGHSATHSRRRA